MGKFISVLLASKLCLVVRCTSRSQDLHDHVLNSDSRYGLYSPSGRFCTHYTMRPFWTTIVFLAFSASARALRQPPQSVIDDCPSVQEVSSTMVAVDGHEIVQQTFTCLDGNFTSAALSSSITSSVLQKRTSLEERSAAECTTPSPQCQCGTATNCGCFNNGPAPATSDCTSLIGSVPVISAIQGPTFLVPQNTFMSITLGTCSLGFINLAEISTQYCWDDLANAGNAVVTCISQLRITSGLCVATNERYFTRLGPSS